MVPASRIADVKIKLESDAVHMDEVDDMILVWVCFDHEYISYSQARARCAASSKRVDIMETVKQLVGSAVGVGTQQASREPSHEKWLRADEVEVVQSDEDDKARQIGELINKMQQHNFDQHQHMFRGTHVKSLAFMKGTLTINPDIPAHLRQGIFQPGSQYSVIARYANEPTFYLPDNQRAPRGLGLKIFGVQGDRLGNEEQAKGNRTQDFMFNNAPMVELTDINTTLEIMRLREQYFDSPLKLQGALALRSDRMKQFAPGMLPNNHLIGDTFFTQSSFSHGPYAAHYSLSPASNEQNPFIGQSIPSDASPTYNREHLKEYYSTFAAKYHFRAQFASDLEKHEVEDASTEWEETTAPWYILATIDFPAQETFSTERRVWWEDTIALSPWNGLKAHRPLGSINRLRRKVYQMSREKRCHGNGREIVFPQANDMPE